MTGKLIYPIFLIFILLGNYNCKNPNEKFDFGKEEVKAIPKEFYTDSVGIDFLNNYLKKEHYTIDPDCKYLMERENMGYSERSDFTFSGIDSLFEGENLDSLKEVFKNERKQFYRQSDFPKHTLINFPENLGSGFDPTIDSVWIEFMNKYKCYLIFDKPVISSKKNLLAIRTIYHCGFDCGEGNLMVFKKNKKGDWEFLRNLDRVQW